MFGADASVGGTPPPNGPPPSPMGMPPQGPGAGPPPGLLEALAAMLGGGQDGLASLSPPDPSDTTGDSLAARLGGIAGGSQVAEGMDDGSNMDPIMMALLMGGQGGGMPPMGGAPPPMMPPARPPGMMGTRQPPPMM